MLFEITCPIFFMLHKVDRIPFLPVFRNNLSSFFRHSRLNDSSRYNVICVTLKEKLLLIVLYNRGESHFVRFLIRGNTYKYDLTNPKLSSTKLSVLFRLSGFSLKEKSSGGETQHWIPLSTHQLLGKKPSTR